jgi:hypothetical protein
MLGREVIGTLDHHLGFGAADSPSRHRSSKTPQRFGTAKVGPQALCRSARAAAHPHGAQTTRRLLPLEASGAATVAKTAQVVVETAQVVATLMVAVPRAFWRVADLHGLTAKSFSCEVVAECDREFRHPDGVHARTYLIEHQDQFFPIKMVDLVTKCLTRVQRNALNMPSQHVQRVALS